MEAEFSNQLDRHFMYHDLDNLRQSEIMRFIFYLRNVLIPSVSKNV